MPNVIIWQIKTKLKISQECYRLHECFSPSIWSLSTSKFINLWQIHSYMNSSKIISQKKIWCIFNVDRVAHFLANVFRYNAMTLPLALPCLSACHSAPYYSAHKRLLLFQCFPMLLMPFEEHRAVGCIQE